MKTIVAACAALALGFPVLAQNMPEPKILRGLEGQKGQWRMEILERSGRGGPRKGSSISVCTDLVKEGREKLRPKEGCKHSVLKDTADEAVVESECTDRKSTVTLKRESDSLLMSLERSGARGAESMTMRYTLLGPCREGAG